MAAGKGAGKKTGKSEGTPAKKSADRSTTGGAKPKKTSGAAQGKNGRPLVGIIMGSKSDYETLKAAEDILIDFGIPYEISVVSAHRTPDVMYEYARSARDRGLKIIIAGAGGAAHLPGMVSALTTLPVLGVPVQSKALSGLDSLLSIVQMPAGIPTATFAVGVSGATNAALFAVQALASGSNGALTTRLQIYRDKIARAALDGNSEVQERALGGQLKRKGAKR
jgi:5-(carboxyamino)imidazole ribonucleotide mutase